MARVFDIAGCSIIEIGCGDGFLTREIITHDIARLWIYEIDPDWAEYIKRTCPDSRITVYTQNFLQLTGDALRAYAPWILLANLPYQVTFPILYWLQAHRDIIPQGVIMVQEEVAQKLVKTGGRGYGAVSLFFQWYYTITLLEKVSPGAFHPPPKIWSRVLSFESKNPSPIPEEEKFWVFVRACFSHPRRTLRNNLITHHYELARFDPALLHLRAQQLTMDHFLELWNRLRM